MLTELKIITIFKKFNQMYFSNRLPLPKIEFTFVKGYIGQFKSHADDTCTISFSKAWELTDFEAEKVLIHEMIHEWQWVNGTLDGHGRTFKRKAREINLLTGYKYDIHRGVKLENPVCLKDRTKPEYNGIIITYRNVTEPKKISVARCSENNRKYIASWLPKTRYIYDVKFYIAHGSYFNSLPQSIKCVHGDSMDLNEYKTKIEPCIVREICA